MVSLYGRDIGKEEEICRLLNEMVQLLITIEIRLL